MTGPHQALTAVERVRLSRWVNKTEETADALLDLLKSAPDPLPRQPIFEPELLDLLSRYTIEQDDQSEGDYPPMRFLELGNGHQSKNKRRALECAVKLLGATQIDHRTVKFAEWGVCHFAAYTHPKGAMISTPNSDDRDFGAGDWHKRDNIVMFRDVGDGRCMIYVSPIEPLFSLRTIGHHGVTWENVRKTAKHFQILASADALKVVPL
ncbi:MAG: hypothetical protein ABI377_09315 [Devosia sp.]